MEGAESVTAMNRAAWWAACLLAPGLLIVAAGGAAAAVPAAERTITVEPATAEVKRYEKIEFTVRAETVGDDPYDPAEIDLALEIATPGGRKVTVPAFYFQPFECDANRRSGGQGEWLYPTGRPAWRVRFAPAEPGAYTAVAVLRDRAGAARSAPVAFTCAAGGDARGYVHVSRRDPRYLECDDGSPFFAVGQDVAFVKDLAATVEMIRRLGAAGANFARVWACGEDWAMAIEARKSAYGRSWDWAPPIVAEPDREGFHSSRLCVRLAGAAGAALTLNPCRTVALRPGTRYRFAGRLKAARGVGVEFDLGGKKTVEGRGPWTPFKDEFTAGADQWWLAGPTLRLTAAGAAWLADLSLTEAAGGPELLWEADPNRPLLGVYNQPDCFLLDKVLEAAEAAGVRLQIVLFTRDHYMAMLGRDGSRDYDRAVVFGRRLVRYAAARWGYSTSVAAWEYFNEMNPGLPTDRFYNDLGEAFERIDVNRHLRATSTWSSPSKDLAHPRLDTADIHYYLRPAEGESWKDAVASVQSRWAIMNRHVGGRKPVLFSEFGITDDKWQRAPELDKDAEFVHLHNALWASALSGFASTVCHWYWDDIQKKDMYHHYGPVAAFVAGIPFTAGGLRPATAACDKVLRLVGLQGGQGAYLWISDPAATWWKIGVEGVRPGEIKGAALTLEGLPAGAYRVEWWDTRTGKVAGEAAARASAPPAPLKLDVPAFSRDIACKVVAAK